jgi:signal transduction histidine kinase
MYFFCTLPFVMKGSLLFFFVFTFFVVAQGQQEGVSSAYQDLALSITVDEMNPDSIIYWFRKADESMEIDRYDSAEYWLSKVGDSLAFKAPGIFNYYYHTRQAEVFYYNDLLQLGLQQTNRSLQIAQQLNDSLFLADAYNFLGLFSLNLDKLEEAEKNLQKGLSFFEGLERQKPLLALSKPYHLHGNIGEVYTKLKQYDKALFHFKRSIDEAAKENQWRPQALAHISSGEVLFNLSLSDSAISTLSKGEQIALDNKDFDVALFGYGVLAAVYADRGFYDKASDVITKGNALMNEHPQLNPFYTLLYLRRVVNAYKAMNDFARVSAMQQEIMNLEQEVRRKNNMMIEDVLSAGLRNENKLLQVEIDESRERQKENNIRTAGLLVIMVLMIVTGLYYRNSLKQKLKLASMREKISQNLHDDIGASISSLHIYGAIAQDALQKQPEKVSDLLSKITEQSKVLMENMNDMVWSMKSDDEEVMPLSTRIKNFGSELLTVKDIHCHYEIDEEAFKFFKVYEERKNILLFIKEAMNNIAKYSGATNATIVFKRSEGRKVFLKIEDNGIGFEPATVKNGNGLKNLKARIEELKGVFSINTAPREGVRLTAIIPIP